MKKSSKLHKWRSSRREQTWSILFPWESVATSLIWNRLGETFCSTVTLSSTCRCCKHRFCKMFFHRVHGTSEERLYDIRSLHRCTPFYSKGRTSPRWEYPFTSSPSPGKDEECNWGSLLTEVPYFQWFVVGVNLRRIFCFVVKKENRKENCIVPKIVKTLYF